MRANILSDKINTVTERLTNLDKKHETLKDDYSRHKEVERAKNSRTPNPEEKSRMNTTSTSGFGPENEKAIENYLNEI